DFEKLAIDLVANAKGSEAALRAAINRAYYAAFHAALYVARLVPGNDAEGVRGRLRHREVPRRLRNWRLLPTAYTRLKPLARRARLAAAALDAAIDYRELADYSLEDEVSVDIAAMQLERV